MQIIFGVIKSNLSTASGGSSWYVFLQQITSIFKWPRNTELEWGAPEEQMIKRQ
jgi:hypothetical protein